ncbi:MAG: histidine biosynthesis protein [Methylobacteriaceae bacterium]|nr:histidine biosynthesis protein [Methylobacteriaceae bacterium]MBV9395525.1 histidine biosynthesis protein [Methylobacteriaceae bacterium]
MEIIPVLDLKAGHVVHAQRGDRDSYQPIVSRLSPSSMPRDVLAALVQLHAFARVYIADLDAIGKTGEHAQIISELARRYPGVEFWLDAGGTARAEMPAADNIRAVIGSESLRDLAALQASGAAAILSLDFRGEDFLGPPDLVDAPALWPDRIIVMTLARVGSGAGPDLDRLAMIKQRAGARRVYAAGGVRGCHDLKALRDAGAAGVLVASALHDGRLTSADIAEFS